MRLGRSKVSLILTEDERVRLDSLAHRSRTAPHLARQARIVLACAEGHDNTVVAKRLRMSQTTVCKWRGRFIRERLDGLYDEPRPGAPRRISDDQGELLERPCAHLYESGGLRRAHVRGHENVLKATVDSCRRVQSRPLDADALRCRHAAQPPGPRCGARRGDHDVVGVH
jgi:transposase